MAQASKEATSSSATNNSSSSPDEEAAAVSSEESHGNDLCIQSKLPTRDGWSEPLVLYQNYWFRPIHVPNIMHAQHNLKPRRDDTILASNPKCGTTWMKALAFAITNRYRYEFGDHPLLSRHPQELVPSIEIPNLSKAATMMTYVDTLPSPRLLATHMPLSLFPKSIDSSGCRIVYICREPKDAFVSRWHFENKINRECNIELEAALNMFCQGFSESGPFWEHCLEYWRESIANPDKVLFLKYEDMMLEPVKHVIRLSAFLGVPFTAKEEGDGVPEELVRLCSFDNLSSLDTNQTGEFARRGSIVLEKSAFFRKGIVGGWVNHMTKEMGAKIDHVVEEKLKGSGLVL